MGEGEDFNGECLKRMHNVFNEKNNLQYSFILTHICTQGQSAHLESVKWRHQEASPEADVLLHMLDAVSSSITFSYRCHDCGIVSSDITNEATHTPLRSQGQVQGQCQQSQEDTRSGRRDDNIADLSAETSELWWSLQLWLLKESGRDVWQWECKC